MNKKEAQDIFEKWYSACIKNGIHPEEIVELAGEMVLITDIELVKNLSLLNLI